MRELSFRIVATFGLVALLSATGPVAAASFQCGGFAPVVSACTTGSRVRSGILSHDVAGDFNYTGTIESSIAWSGGARIFRCTYTPESERACLSWGEFPPVGAGFTHRCRSLVPGSVISLGGGIGVDGVEGGAGTWQCSLAI